MRDLGPIRPRSWYMSPAQRMLLGCIILALLVPAAIGGLLLSWWLAATIGLLPAVTLYIVLLFSYAVWCVWLQTRRQGAGWRSIERWDTDVADEAGSTARGGFPHDPGAIVPKHPYAGTRRKPPFDDE
jgi:hypothetical protein